MSRELQRKKKCDSEGTRRGLDLSGVRMGLVAGSCEQGNESPGSIRGLNILGTVGFLARTVFRGINWRSHL